MALLNLDHIKLPTELTDYIIDEAWEASPGSDDSTCLLSSLALVSHVFRRRVNAHRFATISFANDLTGNDIHSFLELLQADILAPETTIIRYIRRLELLLAGRSISWEAYAEHPSIANGSLQKMLDLVFYQPHSSFHSEDGVTLALHGRSKSEPHWSFGTIRWKAFTPEFVSYLRALVTSFYIGNVELWSVHAVPLTFLKEMPMKKVKFFDATFEKDEDGVLPWLRNEIEVVELQGSNFFTCLPFGSLPGVLASVRTLSMYRFSAAQAKSIWPHLGSLETLIIYMTNYSDAASFEVPYRYLPRLKKLVLNLMFTVSNSERRWFALQILDTLSENIPEIPNLELAFHSNFALLGRFPDRGWVDSIVKNLDCAQIDAFLVHYCAITAPGSTLTTRFHISVSQVSRTNEFRKEGMGVLCAVFPLMNSSSRRGVFDVEFRVQRKVRGYKGAIIHEGIFSVVYGPSSVSMIS
ncbi:hypothetical protein BDN70DRAFT_885304 [Pholiota conissans]|uniref:Uncharacterized protein n=1 Tax=Pholiota conissans TaxID=109636 RepID=A0A9P5YS02_9AGAR|nr:hypothetical protein BDN70DRAFT_885304 [Pholiota conissans]